MSRSTKLKSKTDVKEKTAKAGEVLQCVVAQGSGWLDRRRPAHGIAGLSRVWSEVSTDCLKLDLQVFYYLEQRNPFSSGERKYGSPI